ncbi:UNVERIFIED_CONTAM: hypothetical protein Scaly_2861100 [Sesamum calycinum]|uniref:DUF4283 domain-containing protein n=1 Tax=Sesamum calycinum TaxID=2727403 RepID=A0AAW2LGV1_9LAMI
MASSAQTRPGHTVNPTELTHRVKQPIHPSHSPLNSKYYSDSEFPPFTSQKPASNLIISLSHDQKSFAEILKTHSDNPNSKSQNTDSCKFFLAESKSVPVGTQVNIDGRPTLIFSDTETLSFAAGYRFALIGKFSHGTPQFRNLHRLIAGLGIIGGFIVSMINSRHALISLSNETDFSRLWLRRIWFIEGYPMRVFKWTPTFTPAQESSIVPVWVCLPELPAHLFHKDALFAVANMIGTPLQIDDSTLNQSKLSKARIGIEIDLTKPLVEEFDLQINGIIITQIVEYEQVPKYCSLCKHVGHQESECYSKGNAPNPPPHRRMEGKNEAIKENAHKRQQKMKGKAVVQHARKVLDKFPERNEPSVLMEKGESSSVLEPCQLAVDASSDECEIYWNKYEDNATIHVDEDCRKNYIHEGNVNDNDVAIAEDEITHAKNDVSIAENENASGDVVCHAEFEVVIARVASGKGEENGMHVADVDNRVGDDAGNARNCVENAQVNEETEIVEKDVSNDERSEGLREWRFVVFLGRKSVGFLLQNGLLKLLYWAAEIGIGLHGLDWCCYFWTVLAGAMGWCNGLDLGLLQWTAAGLGCDAWASPVGPTQAQLLDQSAAPAGLYMG